MIKKNYSMKRTRRRDMERNRLQDFCLQEVEVTDAYFVNALDKEIEYLKKFEEDRLVAGFRETKGLQPKAPKYPGWESTEIRGHTLGHYLKAVAQAYATTGDAKLKKKLDDIVTELKESQLESGYLSAFEEQLFDNVERNQPCWVPWYTMDKIIAGLNACYCLAGNETALEIVKKLGNWVYERTAKWTKDVQNTVLAVEYGGMNEAMYELYQITGEEHYREAAHKFDEIALFTPIRAKQDILNGKHANTTIPKFLGALRRYLSAKNPQEEAFYLESVENFWDIVVKNHTYVTGGNSEWEHFGEPKILDGERTNCNCETCNTYNMLKMSRELFKLTKDKKYADFYENTFLNAIMSSQNPETGMTMYFQPMATGYFKVYSTPFDSFWCCTGTGMENFTKCNDSIYFHDETTIYVNQFLSSKLYWRDKGIRLQQKSEIPNRDTTQMILDLEKNCEFTLALRIPDWAAGEIEVTVNDETVTFADGAKNRKENGYLFLTRIWESGDCIQMSIPMEVTMHPLPDNSHVIAFKYGPIVLSAELGSEDMEESKTGVDVTIATCNISLKDFITISEGSVEDWLANIHQNVVKQEGKLEFSLKNTDSDDLIFTPHYRQHTQRYGMYWNMVCKDSKALQNHILQQKDKARRERVAIDSIPLGNDQYELLHNIKGENTGAGTFNGLQLRHAWKDGWFSYDMKVDPSVSNYLCVKYFSGNVGRTFNIYFNDVLYLEETIENVNPDNFYDKYYPIPKETMQGKDTICVKFETRGDSWVGGIFDKLSIVKDYSDCAVLRKVVVEGGVLEPEFSQDVKEYRIRTAAPSIQMQFTPMDENGLVYVNDILIEDAQPREISSVEKQVEVRVTAENHTSSETYHFQIG